MSDFAELKKELVEAVESVDENRIELGAFRDLVVSYKNRLKCLEGQRDYGNSYDRSGGHDKTHDKEPGHDRSHSKS